MWIRGWDALTDIEKKLCRIYFERRAWCYAPRHSRYGKYGHKGVKFARKWHKVENFLTWAIPRYKAGWWLIRLDLSKGYGPENCDFIDPKQAIRQRQNHKLTQLTAFGVSKSLSEWAEDDRVIHPATTLSTRVGALRKALALSLDDPIGVEDAEYLLVAPRRQGVRLDFPSLRESEAFASEAIWTAEQEALAVEKHLPVVGIVAPEPPTPEPELDLSEHLMRELDVIEIALSAVEEEGHLYSVLRGGLGVLLK